jgi:IPT/TIG domain
MALIRYGPLANLVLGSIQGTTFTTSGQGPTAKARTSRPRQSTQRKLAAESATAEVAKLWGSLSGPDQASWAALAATLVRSTKTGFKYRPTAYHAFMSLNLPLENSGDALNAAAPSLSAVPTISTAQLLPTYTPTSPTRLNAAWNAGTLLSVGLILQMTPTFPAGANPDAKRLQRVAVFATHTTPDQDVTLAWRNTFGDLPQTSGYRILARFLPFDRATGAIGCGVDFVLADDSAAPTPAAPTTTTPTTATPATENQLYTTPGDTANPAFLWLNLTPTSTYAITYSATASSATPQLLAGPNVGTLTPIHNFAQNDTVTLTPAVGQLYFIATATWTGTQFWTVLLQTVFNQQPPAVTAVTPNNGPAAGGTSVTITGTNFAARDLVYFGATAAIVATTTDETTIAATSPPGSAGAVDVTVHGAYGCSPVTSADQFTYT